MGNETGKAGWSELGRPGAKRDEGDLANEICQIDLKDPWGGRITDWSSSQDSRWHLES